MGCCFSHPSPSSPYPPAAADDADASSRNITTSSPPHASSLLSHAHSHTTPRASHTSHARPTSSPTAARQNSSIAPNTPLKPLDPSHTCALPSSPLSPSSPQTRHMPTLSSPPSSRRWTRARLARERADFFDTRVTGQAEVWGVVRLVVELVRAGDVAEAQGVLDAAGCTCPTGELWRGVFDERGEWYKVPEWVVVEPGGLEEDDEGSDGGESGSEEEENVKERRVEKGKGRAVDKGPLVKIRARLSDRGTDVVVKIGKEERVGVLVQRVREVAGIPHHTRLKIGYLGKLLHEHESLTAQGWREGHVVNALVFQ